jgi:hypothetical protein
MTDRDDDIRSLWQDLPARVEPLTPAMVGRQGRKLQTNVRDHSTQAYVAAFMGAAIWFVLAVIPGRDPIRVAPVVALLGWAVMMIDVFRHRRRVLRIFANADEPSLTTYRRALEAQRDSMTVGRTLARVVAFCAGFWVLAAEIIATHPHDTGAAVVSVLVALVVTLMASILARVRHREGLSYQRQIDELPDIHPSPD